MMNLYAIYIISNDGRPIFTEYFQNNENIPNEVMLSGLLRTVQMMADEIFEAVNSAESFTLKGITYHLKNFGDFQLVVVTDGNEVDISVINKIGWRFQQIYGDKLENWNGIQPKFVQFRQFVGETVEEHYSIDQTKSIDPSKTLQTAEIFKLPRDIQNVALFLLSEKEVSIDQIAAELDSDPSEVKEQLNKLRKDGYLGIKTQNNKTLYFISS